jgi:4-hydroxybutyrate dehydrogenase / sulfolactaldehyde 3-reductase
VSTIAFIGVGTMGAPMARNIAKGGHKVKAFDVADAALAAVAGDGIEATASPAEAARDADFVITMLPNAPHVEAAAFGPNGLAEAMGSAALYIDMSTIAPAATDKLAARMAERGLAMIDAPVGRQQQHAIEGKLMIMVGGGDAEVARALPILELMGDTIIHCGTTGTGSRMKIVNNYMSISLNVLSSEALVLAERSGLDPEIARKVMMGTAAGQGHFGTTYPAKVLKGDLEPGFMIDLAHKDLGLALEFAAQLNLSVATGAQAHKVYQQARDSGHGGRDWTAIYAVMRKQAGLD